jgi:hypothetical protein
VLHSEADDLMAPPLADVLVLLDPAGCYAPHKLLSSIVILTARQPWTTRCEDSLIDRMARETTGVLQLQLLEAHL